MVQIFAYFKHIQIVRKLELAKIFPEITSFPDSFFAQQLFVYYLYKTPDVPVNMVATYDRLDGERSMHYESKFQISPTCVPGGVA